MIVALAADHAGWPLRARITAELTTLGQKWGLALSQFLLRGGVVVVFETASNSNVGTYRILSPSGLFTADKREAMQRERRGWK